MITQSRLKELLDYNPDTGIITWRVTTNGRATIGNEAGYARPDGYRIIMVDGNKYYSHRLAWLYIHGELPTYEIDHIDHRNDNNRSSNLRDVTHADNLKNQSIPKDNKSGVIGVSWYVRKNRWQAYININGERSHLGSFASKFDAICARRSAENKYRFHANHGIA